MDNTKNKIKISIDCSEFDELMKKANRLKELLEEVYLLIDSLQIKNSGFQK